MSRPTAAPPLLAWFSCHNDFYRCRLAEFAALASLFGAFHSGATLFTGDAQSSWVCADTNRTTTTTAAERIIAQSIRGSEADITLGVDPDKFVWIDLPREEGDKVAKAIAGRGLLLKGIAEIWRHAENHEKLVADLQNTPPGEFKQHVNKDVSFAFHVEAFGHHLSQEEQIARMSLLTFLFEGNEKANLKNPSTTLVILEKWTRSTQTAEPYLEHVYFGRAIYTRPKDPCWWWKYRLSVRPVLGPTTLDNELAFIMCNLGHIKKDMLVFDPFCGTGGILISAAHLGAAVVGSDVDSRVLKGWGVCQENNNFKEWNKRQGVKNTESGSDIFRNFREYKLPLPEIVRIDAGAWSRGNCRRHHRRPWADVIVTDPPYGIRASARQLISSDCNNDLMSSAEFKNDTEGAAIGAVVAAADNAVEREDKDEKQNGGQFRFQEHIPAVSVSNAEKVVEDLLSLAASCLVAGGRLVFLLPVVEANTRESLQILKNLPGFRLESASLQSLSAGNGRVLVSMLKLHS